MAAPVIKIKRNNSGSTPTSLVYGELAADVANQKLYIGNSSGSPVLIGDGAFAGGGIATIQFNAADATSETILTTSPSTANADSVQELRIGFKTQSINTFFCGPISGSSATPTFRSISPTDFSTGAASGKYLTSDGTTFSWVSPSVQGASPSGSNGQLQIVSKAGGAFESLSDFQILNRSSLFLKNSTNGLITIPTTNQSYNKVNFISNNIFSEGSIIGIKMGTTASVNYVIASVSNNSFKAYALPSSSGSAIGSQELFSNNNTSQIELIPNTNSTTPVFFTGTLKTPSTTSLPSTITVASAIINNFKVGMQIRSGIRPVIIRGCPLVSGSLNTLKVKENITTTAGAVSNCYIDIMYREASVDSTANLSSVNCVTILPNNTYISTVSGTAPSTITLSASFLANLISSDTATNKVNDTATTVDVIIYIKGSIRPNTYITHIDTTNNILTLNQRQHYATDAAGSTVTGYATFPEQQVFSFGTPLIKTTSDILMNENISLVKELNDAGRNLEQKILFKSPEAYTVKISGISGANLTLSTKNNLTEICIGDIVLYGTIGGGDIISPSQFTYVKSINYNTGVLTLNAINGLSTTTTQLTLRSSRYVKSVIEHRSFPYDNYSSTYRFNPSNIIKYAQSVTNDYTAGVLDYDLSSNSYENSIWSSSFGQRGNVNNLGSINDMGLYICSDTSIKIGISALSRGAKTDNKSIKEPIDAMLPHISIEPIRYTSNEYNGIYIKNVQVTNSGDLDNSNYFYVLGCRSATPRKNDGFNYLTWYRLPHTAISTLVGGSGTGVNLKEEISELGEPQTIVSLANEVPINTSLTVPLIKGAAGSDLNITTESPDRDIILSIPQSNTDVVLSTGSIYITAGLDSGDIYMQSVDDVFITSQNVRISGNLIVDGYVESATGFQGDTTDGEESLNGLVMDGGTF